jgi:hypothetical protein
MLGCLIPRHYLTLKGKDMRQFFRYAELINDESKVLLETARETVTKTIFIGSREFITLADSGEIISQSPKSGSVSGVWLNTYRVCPPPSYRMWSQLQETLQS